MIHLDNLAYHNGHKVTHNLAAAGIARVPHPFYSPGLSPCDFWPFGLLRESMKGLELSTAEQIVEASPIIWRSVTFYTLQSVFQEWKPRLTWVIKNNGESYFE
jgi:hypothetical protein